MPVTPQDRANEQLKLTANWLNTLASASVALGALTPLALVVAAVEKADAVDWRLLWALGIWIPAGINLHLAARFTLEGPK